MRQPPAASRQHERHDEQSKRKGRETVTLDPSVSAGQADHEAERQTLRQAIAMKTTTAR